MILKILPRVTRANFLPASVIPFLIGAAFAYGRGFYIHPLRFTLGLAGVITAHLAGNTLNDYCDHRTGADNVEIRESPFFGGSRVIQEGLAKARDILRLAAFLFLISFLCGTGIWLLTGNPVFLVLMLVAAFLTMEYTAPPLCLAYRRFGEIDIFILFGVLLVMGSFYLFAEIFTFDSFLISLPVAFLISDVLVCNEIPDFRADTVSGKKNLISLTGQPAGYLLYFALLAVSMLSFILNVFAGNLPPATLTVLLFYLIGVKAGLILKKDFNKLDSSIRASRMTIMLHGLVGLSMIILLAAKRFIS
ncbi:MAG: prenyltransferase [Candidatus Omnitrophota bacterium]